MTVALHHALLRIAGWAPDEAVNKSREWLSQGRLTEVAQVVVFVAVAGRIPVAPVDLDVLETVLRDDLVNLDQLADLDVVAAPAAPWWYAMSPVDPRRHAEEPEDLPHGLDLTRDSTDIDQLDDVDATAVGAATSPVMDGRVDGLWRSWRFPAAPAPWPPPRRLFLMQAADPDTLPMLTAALQQALGAAGEAVPLVEAFTDADALPPYQQTALARSALLWAVRPASPIRIAELFDPVDQVGGPGFAADRSVLDDRERDEVLAYLESANAVLMTTTLMDDVVNERSRRVVPMNVRTDGEWVWTDAVAYYLWHYGLAPHADLLHHIRARRYHVPEIDAVTVHRVLAALQAQTPDADR